MELFRDLGDALFQSGERGDGHHVRQEMARSATSRTDSDLALWASLAIPSVAHLARQAFRPMARSTARRRDDSTAARTSGLRDDL
jgi:hypothetical protein